jgi:hypothetical protein
MTTDRLAAELKTAVKDVHSPRFIYTMFH